MDTWRDTAPHILPPVVIQLGDTCWAVSYIHQMEATVRLQPNLNLPVDQHLSIQEFINILPRGYREYHGTIHGSSYAIDTLTRLGTVLDTVCPLTFALDTPGRTPQHPRVKRFYLAEMDPHYLAWYQHEYEEFGSDLFEHLLEERAKITPVTIRIPSCGSFETCATMGTVYDPSDDELAYANMMEYGHFLLLLGPVIIDGVPCWECQDSSGYSVNGRVYIRRKCEAI
ncbi:PREDICTED: uncharacterized protein LOC104744308 [Camelina sativa]|uniref:Uncharacterized protein LOC104744308 n=1 Tax=Camelina sativa TaxID=90675 RepID=A0ABM0VZL3_CAMSA|nr:PREDICTED: uncharacterized protein LOC104744308 [Camelina sativa]XP_010463638.1 PREDICTED: uncharacterized protein LOC104744308 [Camelina sativa]